MPQYMFKYETETILTYTMFVFLCKNDDLSDVLQVVIPDRYIPGSDCITVLIYLASIYNNLKLKKF